METADVRILYTVLLYLITPLVILRLLWRSRRQIGYRQRICERFGYVPKPPQGIAVWVHAVSVGEALAALPLIRQLIETHGANRVWVTTTTPTGSERVIANLGDQVLHSYAPYDLPAAVARFLDQAQPQQVIIMETELWPNLFSALRARKIPLLIANARLSPRSFKGYSRVSSFARSVLADTTLIAAQSALDGQRFTALGARHVEVTGNIKFDIDPPQVQISAGQQLRKLIGPDRPIWIAASTHADEELAALAAQERILNNFPDALLILVPRHPQRFDVVARQIRESGLAGVRRSALPAELDQMQVLLGDSLGEMWMYLQASDIAFVGGSLVDVGGHNVLEPAALARPVLFGPHMHNFLAARDLLLACGAAQEISDAAALAKAVINGFSAPEAAQAMGAKGREAVHCNRGALAKLLACLPQIQAAP